MNTPPLAAGWYPRPRRGSRACWCSPTPTPPTPGCGRALGVHRPPAHLIIPTAAPTRRSSAGPADAAPGRSRLRPAARLLGVRHGGAAGRRRDGRPARRREAALRLQPAQPHRRRRRPAELEQFGGLLAIDQAYIEFGGEDLSHAGARARRHGGHPQHVQGLRAGRAPGSATSSRPSRLAAQLDAIRLPAGISDLSGALAELALEHVDEMQAAAAGHRGRARPDGRRRSRPPGIACALR